MPLGRYTGLQEVRQHWVILFWKRMDISGDAMVEGLDEAPSAKMVLYLHLYGKKLTQPFRKWTCHPIGR